METDYPLLLSGASSEDEDDSAALEESSDECDESIGTRIRANINAVQQNQISNSINPQPINLLQSLFNRERTGNFTLSSRPGQAFGCAYQKVPNRLSFCLKNIVDNRYLLGHVFMGLTACGQFMLSYKVCCNDNIAANHYSFNVGYKYILFFWIFQPHKPLRRYFQCCLFDDHGVDNVKVVTMTQWKNANSRVLIVHGAAEEESEDSYITYVKVPKLGCLECKKLRETQESTYFSVNTHCLDCNLTVHTKYAANDTDPKFKPHINLLCPERILIIANGFMHMLRIDVDTPVVSNAQLDVANLTLHNSCSPAQSLIMGRFPSATAPEDERVMPPQQQSFELEFSNVAGQSNVIARIIADFSDIESDPYATATRHNETLQPRSFADTTCKTYEEFIFGGNTNNNYNVPDTVNNNSNATTPPATGSSSSTARNSNNSVGIGLKRKRHERIVTKSFRNGIVTIDLQGPTTSSTSAADKSNAYEFSEDNEKCEKISIFRKRRLAEKKYEFSEDNSENIIPFTKMRSAVKAHSLNAQLYGASGSNAHTSARSLHRFSPTAHYFHTNSPCASPSSSPHRSQSTCSNSEARHYASPSPNAATHMEFRSPPSCTSPASSSFMRSPNRQAAAAAAAQIYSQKSPPLSQATQQMLSLKPLGALSPLQISMTKRMDMGGSMSPNAGLSFLSPRREEQRIVEVPIQGGVMPEKPICTKKLRRRYVEEDDATSVITSEEDDCISPGYHTSLPMEVHGACYSEMQMVSQASYQRLRCTSVIITQHSFDLETFTYYVISSLCQKNQKTYDVFLDWAYEVINICPLSQTVSCLLMAQFTAREQLLTVCLNCSRKLDCVFHKRQYECRILFTWNMESGESQVLDYGELKEVYGTPQPTTFAQQAKKLAQEVTANLNKMPDYTSSLRVLGSDINKSKQSIVDHDNMIEFYLRRRSNY